MEEGHRKDYIMVLIEGIYYIKLLCPFVCLSVPRPFFDTTVGPQPNLVHKF